MARDHEIERGDAAEGVARRAALRRGEPRRAALPRPERFDLDRPNNAHLGWGNGPHTCVGIFLAKLELQALLRAMLPSVRSVSVHTPRRLRNNTLQGFRALRACFS